MVSTQFIIDSTAPVISNFSIVNNMINFNVEDKTSIIANVLYSFDGKEWYPVFPNDLINDSKSEKFSFTLKKASSNKILFIKVVDEFNNYKVFQKEI